jgi:hypothetical protein
MSTTTTAHERRFPLHVHISVLFTLLLLLTGVVLGLFNYQQTSRLIFSSSSTLFERIQQDVQRDLDNTYRPECICNPCRLPITTHSQLAALRRYAPESTER